MPSKVMKWCSENRHNATLRASEITMDLYQADAAMRLDAAFNAAKTRLKGQS
jgi:hypothetical protein